MGDSGGPVILDQDGPEIYATIFTIAPSMRDGGVIWVGSDDGAVHLTRDHGATWSNVTPRDAKPFTKISRIDASPHDAGTAYVAGNRYQQDDRAPYVWVTRDYGRTWTRITNGIRADDFVHVVRVDPVQPGLLYAGTEHGVYTSLDDGAHFQSLSLNLPDVQVSDLVVKDNDVVIATHGRSFYVLDDVTALRQMVGKSPSGRPRLFAPADAIRRVRPATIDYELGRSAQSVRIEILDRDNRVIDTLRTGRPENSGTAGLHRVRWNLRYPGAIVFPGIVLEGGSPAVGPWAPPGRYTVRLIADGDSVTQHFQIRADPRLRGVTDSDLQAQFELAMQIRDRTSAANSAVIRIREIRTRVNERLARASNSSDTGAARSLIEKLGSVERELYQVRNQGPKDKIAFPIRLNNRLSGLRWNLEKGDAAPTPAYYAVFRELSDELDLQLRKLDHALASANGELWN